MIKEIMRDPFFLAQKSAPATKDDQQVGRDLMDTLKAHREGCLSLTGVRKATRYQDIEVEYYDFAWKKQRQKFSGWTAQIAQHEIDHCNGIVI